MASLIRAAHSRERGLGAETLMAANRKQPAIGIERLCASANGSAPVLAIAVWLLNIRTAPTTH